MSVCNLLVKAHAESERFRASMERVAATLAKIDVAALGRLVDQIEGYDAHHPWPLMINGREYARRRRSR